MRQINKLLFITFAAAALVFPGTKTHGITLDEFFGSLPPMSLELTFGTYQGTTTNISTSAAVSSYFVAATPTLGIGINIKFPAADAMKYFSDKSWWELGWTSNLTTDNKTISYADINFIGTGDMFYSGLGLNISFWDQGISGGVGAQFKGGIVFSDNFNGGLKLTYLNGTKTIGGYNNYYKIYHLTLDFIYQI